MQPRRVDALARRQISAQLTQSLAELPARAHRIASLRVVQPDREVDEGLQKQPARTALRRPHLLPYFVALEELAAVEQMDAALRTGLP